jgi:hypothetical protein
MKKESDKNQEMVVMVNIFNFCLVDRGLNNKRGLKLSHKQESVTDRQTPLLLYPLTAIAGG